MVGIADTPRKVKNARINVKQWVLLTSLLFFTAALSWGKQFIHSGEVNGLDVQVEFNSYKQVKSNGEYVFDAKKSLGYRVRARNRSGKEFKFLEVQSFLKSDGAECGEMKLEPGANLPGNSKSSLHGFPLDINKEYMFESIYYPPSNICPSSGNVEIQVKYKKGRKMETATLTCPVHFSFE